MGLRRRSSSTAQAVANATRRAPKPLTASQAKRMIGVGAAVGDELDRIEAGLLTRLGVAT